jgi:hypothetical protein
MRSTLALTATVLALAWASPASAQMCGGQTTGATASASTPATGGGAMMCGASRSTASADPMDETRPPSQQGQRQSMCPMMAMTMGGGGMGGMMGGGAQRPSQPAQPSMPGMPATPQTTRPQ